MSQITASAAQPQNTNYLKSQVRVGSIRNGQMNYQKDQTCFNRWDEDVDPNNQKVKEVRNVVRNEIDRDFLGTKKPGWDSSVGIVGHEKEELQGKTLFEIKKGLKDEKIQKIKENKVYAGTDTRDAYHTGWNCSTDKVHHRDAQRFLDAT